MKKEVSCRAFEPLNKACKDGLITEAELLVGIPYDIAYLRNRNERFEWSTWCRLIENARARLTHTHYEELGAAFMDAKAGRAFLVIARLLFQPANLMRWIQGMQTQGDHMFACVESESIVVDKDHVTLTLTIHEGYEDCPEFFYITKGMVGAMTELLAPRRGVLTATIEPRRALYEFYLPRRVGVFSKVKRALLLPFSADTAADELEDAHRGLQQRYEELDQTRTILERQAKQLDASHQLAQVIQQERGLAMTIRAIAKAMPDEIAAMESVEIWINSDTEASLLQEQIIEGTPSEGPALTRMFISHGQELGGLRAWSQAEYDVATLENTIDFLLPSLVIAIENALNYDAILHYRDELELRVKDRTEELSDAKDELSRSLEELQTAEAVRDRIFANLNHELRTPLSIMRLATEEVSSSLEPSMRPLVEAPLRSIDANVTRLLDLVNDLLFLAAHDEGKLNLNLVRIDFEKLVQETTFAWGPLAKESDIDLRYEGSIGQDLLADDKAIQRVLSNLLSNAIKYTPSDGVITVRLRSDETDCHLTVQDTGVGMPPAFVEKAFDRFSQGPAPLRSSLGRSGIGLSLVKELVMAHGGTVSLESQEGHGTTIHIAIPLRKEKVQSFAPSQSFAPVTRTNAPLPATATTSAPGGQTSMHTILIAEDETELREQMARSLSKHYRVLTACNGIEALKLAEAHAPDLLITDLEMPQMDGLELTKRFMELRSNRAAPTLMVTARATLDHRIEGLTAGAIDYISKPFHLSELLARVQAQLSVRDLLLSLHENEKLAAIGFLGAGMAHEFRNPVNMIVNAIKPLRRYLPEDALEPTSRAGMLFEAIENSALRLKDLCKAILELENPEQTVVRSESVRSILVSAVAGTQNDGIVEIRCSEELVAPLSRILVLQILKVLIDNAINHCGEEPQIEISAKRSGNSISIQVSDDGPGIPAKNRQDVFTPFFTTAEPGEGTGLGLALAQKLAHRHLGALKVLDSDVGCTIELRVPYK